jgi:hypothetical protein
MGGNEESNERRTKVCMVGRNDRNENRGWEA